MNQKKKNDWKGDFKKLEGRLGEIDNYRKSVDKVNSNIIRIEIIHALIALVIVLVSIRQCTTTNAQNKLVESQNNLIEAQNEKIDIQSNLAEAQRRGSLVFLLSNVLDQIDNELKQDIGEPELRDLSEQLISRIAALSNQFKPYKYLEDGRLIDNPLSPERGQLFYNITNSNIDKETLIKIFRRSNFQYSDLRDSKISNAYVIQANLDHSNFSGSAIDKSTFYYSSCKECKFTNCKIEYSSVQGKDEFSSMISKIKNHYYTNFEGSDFTDSQVFNSIFHADYLKDCTFKNTLLYACKIQNEIYDEALLNNTIPNLDGAIVGPWFFSYYHPEWESLYYCSSKRQTIIPHYRSMWCNQIELIPEELDALLERRNRPFKPPNKVN